MSKLIINALPELIDAGVITSDTAEQVKKYYGEKAQERESKVNVIFGIIGAILVGLGIILIVAHNWDELSRPVRVMFAFVPLLIGQIACGYSLLKKRHNITWRESSACFLFFAVATSISLVAQIYNLPGDFKGFLFTWMLLSFPLMYLMPSSVVSLLFLAGITVYAVNDGYGYRASGTYNYWWMLLLMLPHYFSLITKSPGGRFTFFHHCALPLSLTICLGTLLTTADGYETIAYAGLFATFCFIPTASWLTLNERNNAHPITVVGSIGLGVVLLAASFLDFWQQSSNKPSQFSLAAWLGILVPTVFAATLTVIRVKSGTWGLVGPLIFTFPAFCLIFFIGRQYPFLGALLMNLLLLSAGILFVLRGLKLNNFGVLNVGLLLIAVLVICRFFDTDISFVMRGVLFMAVGGAFFFANNLLAKKRRAL